LLPLDLDFDVGALDAQSVATQGFSGGWAQRSTSRYVEYGAMPWAGYFPAVDFAFAQRTADMGAIVINRVEASGNIEERDFVAVHLNQFGAAGRDFVYVCDFCKL
jgi:hypothetical protein